MATLSLSLAIFLIFTLGLIIGSFLNVVIIRSVKNESLGGRSSCRSCKTKLTARELIPLISFCIQKGRCRNCGAVLLKQYFWVELITGLAFSGVFYMLATTYSPWDTDNFVKWLIFGLALVSSAIVIVATDLRSKIIPHGPVIVLLILGIIASVNRHGLFSGLVTDLMAAIVIAAFFFVLWLYSKGRWMGLGDAKLILASSLLVGYPLSIAAFLFSFWTGGIMGIGLILLHGRNKIKYLIPFGPFILLGSLLAYIFGGGFLMWSGLIYLL
ncbi:MAG: prepilin peptidase [bacterium]|nr:prepilin peptidase [bacterium]